MAIIATVSAAIDALISGRSMKVKEMLHLGEPVGSRGDRRTSIQKYKTKSTTFHTERKDIRDIALKISAEKQRVMKFSAPT